jgi:hypothetical protein
VKARPCKKINFANTLYHESREPPKDCGKAQKVWATRNVSFTFRREEQYQLRKFALQAGMVVSARDTRPAPALLDLRNKAG